MAFPIVPPNGSPHSPAGLPSRCAIVGHLDACTRCVAVGACGRQTRRFPLQSSPLTARAPPGCVLSFNTANNVFAIMRAQPAMRNTAPGACCERIEAPGARIQGCGQHLQLVHPAPRHLTRCGAHAELVPSLQATGTGVIERVRRRRGRCRSSLIVLATTAPDLICWSCVDGTADG